jgi:putative membrane protein
MPNALALTIRVIVVAVSLWVAALIVGGIRVGTEVSPTATTASTIGTLVVVAIIFGLVNAFLKPIIKVIGCPLYVLTLGLIGFVVNALLLWLVGWLAGLLNLPFAVDGFWAAFWGAIIIAVVSFVLHLVIPDRLDQR